MHLKAAHPRVYAAWRREDPAGAPRGRPEPEPAPEDAPEERAPEAVVLRLPAVIETCTVSPEDEDPEDEDSEPERPLRAGDVITPTGRLIGRTEPRLFTPPLRPLNRESSWGFEVIEFARDVLCRPLLPWQCWVVIHALELAAGTTRRPPPGEPWDWRFRFRTVLIMVARQNGKSDLARVVKLWKLFMLECKLVIGTAQDLDIAREMLSMANDLVDSVPDLAEEKRAYITANGKEKLELTDGRKYVIKASNRKAGRSLTADHVDLDELREHQDWKAWGALSKTTNARPNGQCWALSNAGDEDSVPLNTLRENALANPGGNLFLAEYSGEEDCAIDDETALCQANPALGYTVSEEAVRWSPGEPPEIYRTEVLCQNVAQLDGAVNVGAWRAGKDAAGSLADADRIVSCVDVAPDGAHVSLVGAGAMLDGRIRVEVLSSWSSVQDAVNDLPDLVKALRPARFVWPPTGPAAAMNTDVRALASLVRGMELVELTGSEVSETCMEFARLVKSGLIVNSGDALLDEHIRGAKKLFSGDGWRFVRRGAGHVDAAYAAAGAVHELRKLPAPRRRVKLVV